MQVARSRCRRPTRRRPRAADGQPVAQALDERLAPLRTRRRGAGRRCTSARRPSRETTRRHDARGLGIGAGDAHARPRALARAGRRPATGTARPARSRARPPRSPARVSLPGGNWRSAPLSDVQLRAPGRRAPAAPRSAPAAARTGRRMTAPVQRAQNAALARRRRRAWPPRRPVIRAPTAEPTAAIRPRARRAAPSSDEQRRQQRRGREHRDGDDEDRAERHRAQRGRVDSHRPASETITVRPEKATATPEVAIARPRGSRARAGADLLAVAREHEQRVVDGDADADHRRHVASRRPTCSIWQREQRRSARRSPSPRRRRGASGSSAAASEPNTASRISSTIGKPVDSAFARSSLREVLHARPTARPGRRGASRPAAGGRVGDAEPRAQVDGDVDRVASSATPCCSGTTSVRGPSAASWRERRARGRPARARRRSVAAAARVDARRARARSSAAWRPAAGRAPPPSVAALRAVEVALERVLRRRPTASPGRRSRRR